MHSLGVMLGVSLGHHVNKLPMQQRTLDLLMRITFRMQLLLDLGDRQISGGRRELKGTLNRRNVRFHTIELAPLRAKFNARNSTSLPVSAASQRTNNYQARRV